MQERLHDSISIMTPIRSESQHSSPRISDVSERKIKSEKYDFCYFELVHFAESIVKSTDILNHETEKAIQDMTYKKVLGASLTDYHHAKIRLILCYLAYSPIKPRLFQGVKNPWKAYELRKNCNYKQKIIQHCKEILSNTVNPDHKATILLILYHFETNKQQSANLRSKIEEFEKIDIKVSFACTFSRKHHRNSEAVEILKTTLKEAKEKNEKKLVWLLTFHLCEQVESFKPLTTKTQII